MNSISDLNALRYPIGHYIKPNQATKEQIETWIETIETFPNTVTSLVDPKDKKSLNFTYRPGGWDVKRLVHHCADSHMNAFIRFKLALTEDVPAIKPYFEDRWANLPDSSEADVTDSLNILNGLHSRWGVLLRSMNDTDMNRELFHPEHDKKFSLWGMLGMYAWHCNHHLAHIKLALKS